MKKIIEVIDSINDFSDCHFSIVSCNKEQYYYNVSMVNPVLVVVLRGEEIINNCDVVSPGQFIFLSKKSFCELRKIPEGKKYLALIIEFKYEDFSIVKKLTGEDCEYFSGSVDGFFKKSLLQFVEWGPKLPDKVHSFRKKELLSLLCSMGYEKLLVGMINSSLSTEIKKIYSESQFFDVSVGDICSQLGMSASTLRRKLFDQSSSVQEIKDKSRFSRGLYLLQASDYPINLIAEKCGYHSLTRFSERFKERYGGSPSEIRAGRKRAGAMGQ